MGTIVENPFPFASPGGLQGGKVNPTAVASAIAHPAPTALVTTVSGTAAMTTIGLPWPGFTGFIIFIPTGAFTGATGGTATATALPIGLAFQAVVGIALVLVCDGANWYPSYAVA